MGGHLELDLLKAQLASAAMFVSLAQNYRQTGHQALYAENTESAQKALSAAQLTFAKLNDGTDPAERQRIEARMSSLADKIQHLRKLAPP